MPTDLDKPVPLTQLITGTLTMHFPGAVVNRRMSLAEAQSLEQAQADDRASDRLAWSALAWFQWSSDKVLATTFDVDEDLGFELTRDERNSLAANGHPRGVLRSLRDHWKGIGREPSYSARVIHHLHRTAVDGVSANEFVRLAELLEGDDGARRLQDVLDRLADSVYDNQPTNDGTENHGRSQTDEVRHHGPGANTDTDTDE